MKRCIVFLAACAPSVPDAPSFQEHVSPILAANCVRCHGVPQIGGAPPEFRLDSAGDTRDGAAVVYAGAITMALNMAGRVADDDSPMPPRFPLDDYQIDTIAKWANDPQRLPRLGNRRPNAAVLDTLETISEEGFENRVDITITLRIDDDDGDMVGGSLRANGAFIGVVHVGTNQIVWNATDVATGDYPLQATLDDGGVESVLSLGTVHVEAP